MFDFIKKVMAKLGKYITAKKTSKFPRLEIKWNYCIFFNTLIINLVERDLARAKKKIFSVLYHVAALIKLRTA